VADHCTECLCLPPEGVPAHKWLGYDAVCPDCRQMLDDEETFEEHAAENVSITEFGIAIGHCSCVYCRRHLARQARQWAWEKLHKARAAEPVDESEDITF